MHLTKHIMGFRVYIRLDSHFIHKNLKVAQFCVQQDLNPRVFTLPPAHLSWLANKDIIILLKLLKQHQQEKCICTVKIVTNTRLKVLFLSPSGHSILFFFFNFLHWY